ncbi:hypothetical protein [Amycolatopsis australiensis]|uniref:Uncharacterized protein n=1 Tax=Amycolatopsis australiensis TaxID=546364 RepID=A0A1K1T9B3_9PSEU|nr:hypothetical protein [Amycolatopsis australiensis]SFW93160.1 hypothetical protein SAMN04489730_8777 [Amycolatopsis australiensis]
MAAGPFIIPDKAVLNIALGLLNSANTFKLSYHTSAWAPNPATLEVFADVSSEIAAAGGYSSGGITLGNDALTISGSTVKFTGDAAELTAAGGSIPAWRYGVVRAIGTINGKVDPVVGYFLGDATPADVPATTVGNKLTFTPNAAGICTISKAA